MVGSDREELLRRLAALAGGRRRPTTGVAESDSAGGVVFVFPGQGSQWRGMALELMESSPVFAARIAECAQALARSSTGRSRPLRGDGGLTGPGRRGAAGPVGGDVSLAELWSSYGCRPAAVVGHCQGEIAAACVAGALSLEDAAWVATRRSQALTAIAGGAAWRPSR